MFSGDGLSEGAPSVPGVWDWAVLAPEGGVPDDRRTGALPKPIPPLKRETLAEGRGDHSAVLHKRSSGPFARPGVPSGRMSGPDPGIRMTKLRKKIASAFQTEEFASLFLGILSIIGTIKEKTNPLSSRF